MNWRWVRRILILAAAAALCLVMTRVSALGPQNGAAALTIWYDGGECSPAVMEGLAALCQREAGLRIETRGFENEAAMGLAFEEERPDLVFCSAARALGFEKRGRLEMIGDGLPIPEALRGIWPEIGESFFPVGGRLPLLLVNTALVTETYENLESLLAATETGPFLTSDDWAELLHTAMCAEGELMTGDPAEDTKSKTFRRLYNELAEASFRGGLVTTETPADYVRQGLIPCAVVRSTEIAGLADRDIYVRPLPLPLGAEAQYPAEVMGFALPEGADAEAAAGFLRWFYSGKTAGETAVAAGLVPITEAAEAKTGLETALVGLSQLGLVRWCAPDEVFFRSREACELHLREMLDMLR